ncbi:class I SAM-dependent methyltransferase [Streptomyces sp. NPDC060031]|uniref:class I SAM-dependent methyltransferase n=1 Tax=Streptomyces sp. NPDC060031 TaxID=3347043 RepID=UPI00368EE128
MPTTDLNALLRNLGLTTPWAPTHAGGWDERFIAQHGPITPAEQQFVNDHVLIRTAGRTAVEVGCGTGRFAHQLHHAHGYHVTGLDLAHANLQLARVRGEAPGLLYMRHDVETGPPPHLPVDGIDLVVARQTTLYLRDPQRWIHQVRTRWLRPGGCLYLQVLGDEFDDQRVGRIGPENIASYTVGWATCAHLDEGPRTHLALHTSM